MTKRNGEKIAAIESRFDVKMSDIDRRLTGIETSIKDLGTENKAAIRDLVGRFDTLTKIMTDNYVAKDTFEQYKKTIEKEKEVEDQKNKTKNMERIIWIFLTAAITSLVSFFVLKGGI